MGTCPCSEANGSNLNGSTGINGQRTIVDSWYGMANVSPKNPLEIIAYAKIDETVGVPLNSSTYIIPSSSAWATDGTRLSSVPVCVALGTDNVQQVADAAQWNFQHLTATIASTLAPPLRKLMFLRGGSQWKMQIPLLTSASALDIELSFRNNAGTRGDAQGTVPVIHFAGTFASGAHTLEVTLNTFGQVSMGLRLNLDGTNYSMYEMEWIAVP